MDMSVDEEYSGKIAAVFVANLFSRRLRIAFAFVAISIVIIASTGCGPEQFVLNEEFPKIGTVEQLSKRRDLVGWTLIDSTVDLLEADKEDVVEIVGVPISVTAQDSKAMLTIDGMTWRRSDIVINDLADNDYVVMLVRRVSGNGDRFFLTFSRSSEDSSSEKL